jgi:CheY-like chemotaxis protein
MPAAASVGKREDRRLRKEEHVKESILNNKRILAVDDEVDVLEVLRKEILLAAPDAIVDTATTFEQGSMQLVSWTYDLVILDIMGVRGFDLLQKATARESPIPAVMLTAHSFSPESLKRSISLGARAYLPKELLGAIVPFLEDVLTYEYGPVWKRLIKSIEGVFSEEWGPYWRKPDNEFWERFEKRISKK